MEETVNKLSTENGEEILNDILNDILNKIQQLTIAVGYISDKLNEKDNKEVEVSYD